MPNKSYIVSVSLGAGCYRHIRISAGAMLMELHAAILNAFQFDDDHAHVFFMDNRLWSDEDSYYSEGIEDTERFTSEYTLDDAGCTRASYSSMCSISGMNGSSSARY